MKKVIVSTILFGSVLIGMVVGKPVYAGETTGGTLIRANVVKGEISLLIAEIVDFGSQPLAKVVDFGTKEIKYIVTDNTGDTNGYQISAKVTDEDTTRSLKIGKVELNNELTQVIKTTSNVIGDNESSVDSSLIYTGATTLGKRESTIHWNLTKADVKQISE